MARPESNTIIEKLTEQLKPHLGEAQDRVFGALEQGDRGNQSVIASYVSHPILNAEEEGKLLDILIGGRDENGCPVTPEATKARDLLMAHNGRLVLSIVLKTPNTKGVPIGDLLQEGATGLMKALSKFEFNDGNPTRNRLSTYATWWISQRVVRATNVQGGLAGVPEYLIKDFVTVRKTIEKLEITPTPEAIAKETGIPLSRVTTVMEMSKAVYSLQLDALSFVGCRDKYFVNYLSDLVHEILAMRDEGGKPIFSERERDIIISRFGLNNKIPETLKSIGKHHGVSDERIRQIQKGAMRKFRKYEDLLIDFYE